MNNPDRLRLLPLKEYASVDPADPLRSYFFPVVGSMYRRRVELCLAECRGGERVLEVGFGSGITFLNLHDKYGMIYGLDLTASVKDVQVLFAGRQIETQLLNGDVLKMPYDNDFFDTVLLISILEHIKREWLVPACREIRRVLKPGGQMVYGVPVERPLMSWGFGVMGRVMGYKIEEHHFSTEKDVFQAASTVLRLVRLVKMGAIVPGLGAIYKVGHFVKELSKAE